MNKKTETIKQHGYVVFYNLARICAAPQGLAIYMVCLEEAKFDCRG